VFFISKKEIQSRLTEKKGALYYPHHEKANSTKRLAARLRARDLPRCAEKRGVQKAVLFYSGFSLRMAAVSKRSFSQTFHARPLK